MAASKRALRRGARQRGLDAQHPVAPDFDDGSKNRRTNPSALSARFHPERLPSKPAARRIRKNVLMLGRRTALRP